MKTTISLWSWLPLFCPVFGSSFFINNPSVIIGDHLHNWTVKSISRKSWNCNFDSTFFDSIVPPQYLKRRQRFCHFRVLFNIHTTYDKHPLVSSYASIHWLVNLPRLLYYSLLRLRVIPSLIAPLIALNELILCCM